VLLRSPRAGSEVDLGAEPTRASAAGVALLVDGLEVDAGGLPVPDGVGVLTLSARSSDGAPVFLGVANGQDLDTYLAGAPYDVVASLSTGGTATTRTVPGTQQPPPPSSQPFWLRQDEGSPAELTARIPEGATVVLMKSDATPGIAADLRVSLEVDRAWPAALVIGGAGLVLVGVGVALLLASRRRSAPALSGAHSAPVAATVLPGADAPAEPGGAVAPGEPSDG
jgi:hypothetical protein